MNRILYIFVCLFCLNSCLYEDKGNYDYHRLPDLEISGIEEKYGDRLLFTEYLEIAPTVKFIDEEDEAYSFAWYERVNNEQKLISETKNLKYLPDNIGRHDFRFVVIHKETGLKAWVDTYCNVYSKTERGFYVLKQNADGSTDMDAFLREQDGSYTKMENIITLSTGAPLTGDPKSLDYNKFRWDNQEEGTLEVKNALFPTTSEDIAVIDLVSLNQLASYEDLFLETMPSKENRKIKGLYSNSSSSVLIYEGEDGKSKVRTRTAHEHSTFGFVYEGYDPHPYALGTEDGGVNLMLYDRESGDFLKASGERSKYEVLSKKVDGTFGKYPMAAPDCDIMFMGQSDGKLGLLQGKTIGYLLMKKRHAPDSILLALFKPKMLSTMTSYSAMQQIDTLSAKKVALARADFYTMHQDGGVMYFSIGNSINKYYINSKKEGIDILRVPDGEITWMKFLRNDYVDTPLRFNSLLIATYDKAADTYKLSLYNIDSNDNPQPTPHTVLEGKGRLHSAKYVIPVNLEGNNTFFKNYYYY